MQAPMTDLVEQHIIESESHLRRIDEMMARAREAQAGIAAPGASDPLLSRIRLDRDRLAGELADLRRRPRPADAPGMREQAAGVQGALHRVGVELEKALTAILDGR
jgi:hypothetical protein